MGFSKLPLHAELLKVIEEMGYTEPSAIQEKVIPLILENKDIRGSAPTGTGKTAAYMLPLLTRLAKESSQKKSRGPKVLILVPTRELALQVHAETQKFCRYLKHLKAICIYGGASYIVQNKQLQKPYDILIATPGRLIDHLDRQRVRFDHLETLILDEADRLLDMGFIEPIEYISNATPDDRQTLLFSATFNKRVMQLSKNLQNDEIEVIVAPPKMDESLIEQRLHHVDDIHHKNRLLEHLVQDGEIKQAVVFTSTKIDSERIAERLFDLGIRAAALHGDMNQRQRNRTMTKMRESKIQILVATDVAARGIDIKDLSHVINFDLPFCPEDYVHRIGRTGRAGSKGIAVLFATGKEMRFIQRLEKETGLKLTLHCVPGFEPTKPIEKNSPRNPTRKRHSFGRGKGKPNRSNGSKSFGSRSGSGSRSSSRSDSDSGSGFFKGPSKKSHKTKAPRKKRTFFAA